MIRPYLIPTAVAGATAVVAIAPSAAQDQPLSERDVVTDQVRCKICYLYDGTRQKAEIQLPTHIQT